MIKKIILLCFIQMSLLASTYNIGMQYYKNAEYEKSYTEFHKIYLDNLSDIKFNFYFGKSAYESGHYEIALAAFERVEMQDGSNLRNKLEIARTYYMLKMYEDSQNAFEEVLDNPNIPENIRRNIELSLSRVSKVQKKSFTYAQVMLDMIYDSNVNYGSIDDYYYGGVKYGKTDELSDMAIQAYIDISNIYDIGNKGGFAIKNTVSVFSKNYLEESDYSLQHLSYTPSLIYKTTKYTAEIVLGIDTMFLGSDNYLSTLYLMPKFEYVHTPTLRSLLHVKLQQKEFQQDEQEDYDAMRYEASYGLQKILTPRSYIQVDLIAAMEDKDHGDLIYVDFEEYKANLNYVNQFTADWSVNIFAQLRRRNYDDKSNGFSSYREDTGGIGNLGFTYKLNQTLRLKLGASYEYVDSNQERFTYDKQIATVGIVKTF